MTTLKTNISKDTSPYSVRLSYSIEFFHIYVDEKFTPTHLRSLEYLKSARKAWDIDANTVILIDNYNPAEGSLKPEDVFIYLEKHGEKPDYWAYESSLVECAEKLLNDVSDKHLYRNYRSYIASRGKYPCSLLTSAWYLLRLGELDSGTVIKKCGATTEYQSVDHLINILPVEYRPVEKRALELIMKSKYNECADMIQDLFFESDYKRKLALF